MPEVFLAIEPFTFTSRGGVPRNIRTGDPISSDDPDFKGREHLFEPALASANRATETASAAPGERRNRGRPARQQGDTGNTASTGDGGQSQPGSGDAANDAANSPASDA